MLFRSIEFHRRLAALSRIVLMASRYPPAWLLGTVGLSVAKILENMEIGHNVMHGQWDWMNDPEIHSTSWEWDLVGSSADWKHTHNHLHHKFTNIVGMDDDVGFGVLRVTRDVPWEPKFLANMAVNAALMAGFEWGIGLQAVTLGAAFDRDAAPEDRRKARAFLRKAGQQILKDYVLFPVLAGPSGPQALTATVTANIIRNVWTNAVIFCGHFADGARSSSLVVMDEDVPFALWNSVGASLAVAVPSGCVRERL